MHLTKRDIGQIEEMGKTVDEVLEQIESFRKGFPPMRLARPCTLGDGVTALTDRDAEEWARRFEENSGPDRSMKFVPASGAASRMFRQFFSLLKKLRDGAEIPRHLAELMVKFPKFAFYDDLKTAMRRDGLDLAKKLRKGKYRTPLTYLLGEKGLNYGHLPKGLILFHDYPEGARTAFEEQLVEGVGYVKNNSDSTRIHFTAPPAALEAIRRHIEVAAVRFQGLSSAFEVDFSIQDRKTDTIAVDLKNRPFRTRNGRLYFRPGGHGALLGNLNALKGDLVFIKNIDNVAPDRLKDRINLFKRALGGILISLQEKIFSCLREFEAESIDPARLSAVEEFARDRLLLTFPSDFSSWPLEKRREALFDRLNRPIRVCGVVRNEGEPGGGPFWVRDADGLQSLQIVESHQVNRHDPEQLAAWEASQFFNPVDLVCGLQNFRGRPFDLMRRQDPNTAFIARKSMGGQDLKALELPGLWNGAMADWTTVFAEVPIETFNPAKTVGDLLRPEHLSD